MPTNESLSPSVLRRAQLVRLMKTVLAIKESAKQESVRRMAMTLAEQLTDIMPELSEVGAWHAVGKRRRLNELGIAAERRISEEVFVDLTE